MKSRSHLIWHDVIRLSCMIDLVWKEKCRYEYRVLYEFILMKRMWTGIMWMISEISFEGTFQSPQGDWHFPLSRQGFLPEIMQTPLPASQPHTGHVTFPTITSLASLWECLANCYAPCTLPILKFGKAGSFSTPGWESQAPGKAGPLAVYHVFS